VTDKIYQLLVTANGREVWTAQTTATASTKLPTVLLDAKAYPPIGLSSMTAQGLQPMPPPKAN